MSNNLIDAVRSGRLTLADALKQTELAAQQGNWTPASGGTETPFVTRSGRTLLYCYQASTGRHAYLDCGTDLILSDSDAALALGIGND
jgi:hypothetical protein